MQEVGSDLLENYDPSRKAESIVEMLGPGIPGRDRHDDRGCLRIPEPVKGGRKEP